MQYRDRKSGKLLTRASDGGIVCSACGCKHFLRVYTDMKLPGQIKRCRECRHCGHRVITTERVSYEVRSYIGTESGEAPV